MTRAHQSQLAVLGALLVVAIIAMPIFIFTMCMIQVPREHMAVMTKKTGKDLPNGEEIAPTAEYKGLQKEFLFEGRRFRNPYVWDWQVVPQVNVPAGKLGVRIRLYGEELKPGEIMANNENQKGIVREILRAGRHRYNAIVVEDPSALASGYAELLANPPRQNFAEVVEIHDPVTVPAGYRGVVTNLTGPLPAEPNTLLVKAGERGVQEETLAEETYYFNPYEKQVHLVNCQSQRHDLSEGGGMGFPSKDGFFVSLDGRIEFRVNPEKAASVFVTYKSDEAEKTIDQEIVSKVILPNARSFCRLRGSNYSGRDFISGTTRTQFEKDFEKDLAETCRSQGIDIIKVAITKTRPPEQIAKPVRDRQIAEQTLARYVSEIEQQKAEQLLAIETETVKQKQALVAAEQETVKTIMDATRKQEVAIIDANRRLAVALTELKAAEDLAAAVVARGKAAADVIQFDNEAEAAGWAHAVSSFGGDGGQFAKWTLLKKLAPSFQRMMVNTSDSPLLTIFDEFSEPLPQAEGAEKPSSTAGRSRLPSLSDGVIETPSVEIPDIEIPRAGGDLTDQPATDATATETPEPDTSSTDTPASEPTTPETPSADLPTTDVPGTEPPTSPPATAPTAATPE